MPVATARFHTPSPTPLPQSKRPQGILRGTSSESYHKKRPSSSVNGNNQDITAPKRPKVQFTPRPIVHIVRDEDDEKSITLVTAEVRQALMKHNDGESSQDYEELQQLFDTPEDDEDAPSNKYLGKCLIGLASSSHLTKRNSASLVHSVLGMKWLHRDDDFVCKFQKFLGHLVSSQGGFVGSVLKKLVENFAHLSTSSSGTHRTPGLTRQALQDRVHACIRHVLFTVPSGSNVLCNILTSTFPYITETRRAHVEYVQNLLRLSTSNPELRSHILDLTLDRLVAIDVQVQIDIADLEEDVGDVLVDPNKHPASSQTYFGDDASSSCSPSSSSDSEDEDSHAAQMKSIAQLVAKMDAILDHIFTYLHPLLTKSTPVTSQQTFDHLLAHLRNTLLRTPSSRHTQFLVFWAAQIQPAYTQQFLDATLNILTDPARPSIFRVAAATYISAFTARANTLTSDTILYVFDGLLTFLNQYRKLYETSTSRPDLRKHAHYYAAVQACLYAFCFRWRDLLHDLDPEDTTDDLLDAAARQELKWDPRIKDALTSSFMGRLNPLKVCTPEIVSEFADAAYRLGFCYAYAIIESNKRVRLLQQTNDGRETSLSGLHSERLQQLEGWFPFDPYHLPRSRRWIDGIYFQYATVAEMNQVGGEEGDDEVSDEDMTNVKEESEGEDDDVGTPDDD